MVQLKARTKVVQVSEVDGGPQMLDSFLLLLHQQVHSAVSPAPFLAPVPVSVPSPCVDRYYCTDQWPFEVHLLDTINVCRSSVD